MTKIPKRLMRDFLRLTLPDMFKEAQILNEPDLATVIELAAEWCGKNSHPFCFGQQYAEPIWEVSIGSVTIESANLIHAIMEAVVAASREGKNGN